MKNEYLALLEMNDIQRRQVAAYRRASSESLFVALAISRSSGGALKHSHQ